MDSGLALRAPRNDGQLFLPRHLLRSLPEHILSSLFVERRLFEFSHRQSRLHLRPRADIGIPALDVRIIVERKALRLVRHGPWKAGDISDRIVARDVAPRLAQLGIEHAIKPGRLVAVAFDGIRDFLLRVECEMAVLAEHATQPARLPHHPLQDVGPPAHVLRKETAGLVGEINQDRAGLEYRNRLAAIGWCTIHNRRNAIVRTDRQKFRLELFTGPDVDGNDPVGKAELFQHDRDFPAVRRRRIIEVDHGSSAILKDPTLEQSLCGLKPPRRHGRACSRPPRLDFPSARKTWMAGASPPSTKKYIPRP